MGGEGGGSGASSAVEEGGRGGVRGWDRKDRGEGDGRSEAGPGIERAGAFEQDLLAVDAVDGQFDAVGGGGQATHGEEERGSADGHAGHGAELELIGTVGNEPVISLVLGGDLGQVEHGGGCAGEVGAVVLPLEGEVRGVVGGVGLEGEGLAGGEGLVGGYGAEGDGGERRLGGVVDFPEKGAWRMNEETFPG